MITFFILACSRSSVQLIGESKGTGDPAVFVQLCTSKDLTAMEIATVAAEGNCQAAGEILSRIDTIDFNKSSLETVKLKVLEGLSNIRSVSAYGKNIDDISALKGLLRLEELYLMQNKITDLSPLQGLKQIKYLRLDGNEITDISVLSELKKLEKIGLDANQISDFRPIAKLPIIQDLNTNFNPVDLSKCPDGEGVTKKLNKYCKRMKKNAPDLQGAIDPK
jgi:Leucine-rich repeat (LRR) protein